jgi:CrcB protein
MLRFFLSDQVARIIGQAFPWGTLVVNVSGAMALGAFAVLLEAGLFTNESRAWALVATGFLGSYTTVSSFSLQTLELARQGSLARAAGNVLISLLLCLGGAAIGFTAADAVLTGGPR